ncbi:MAG: bifunctional phosphopantothenoylcysteine decarboxylase/phosphopantothenate--cysteine ligase CoaBC [Flavobacteriales bacterium]
MVLKGKKILLGVTGGIAAYKAAFLVRLLVKEQAEVKVIMTESAKEFITPLTLAVLSKNSVESTLVTNDKWTNHVEWGMWADLFIIAPLTANTLSKMAHGICDNLLLATYLSAKCPVVVAPSMDLDMYAHAATQMNLEKLYTFGNICIKPEEGELASGLIGEGRMAEPEDILEKIKQLFNSDLPLKNKKILISAGPTYEKIDPIRFLGNHSTGKMGYALAEQAAKLGAEVILVSGPSNEVLSVTHNIQKIKVTSAEEMLTTIEQLYTEQDIVIMAAAVADYRPKKVAQQKIKKQEAAFSIELERTTDILKVLGEKKQHQLLVGFALETHDEEQNALSKLRRKNLDFIVLNSLQDQGAGFKKNTNKITIFDRSEKKITFDLKSKQEVALDILNTIVKR